ncbi:uncharacterized protein cubi_00982 [Cryptosporidium ubiquitum]|uniref:Uncharacterized protein n=1 Tax=Cryptosporidium ubiquitum TaxID=857276 RepID=A0A1J4MD98_9CRYT|nr:uncharacterized protein cubi_00982 [Cryptosporidium ubiquitum]OII70837.1 hypothetical protein cubi_00982 [Cryptosporidium ubiquitum]
MIKPFFLFPIIFFVFFFKDVNDDQEILNSKIREVSLLRAEGGKSLKSSLSLLSLEDSILMDLEKAQSFLPASWFTKVLGTEPSGFLLSVGIKSDLTSPLSCNNSMLEKTLKELKKSLQELILVHAQIQHYEEHSASGKYLTSSFNDYLAEKRETFSKLKNKIESILEKAIQCIMLINLEKYSKKKFAQNTINCNSSTLLLFSSLQKLSEDVLKVLIKLVQKFKGKYKSSTKIKTASFDHSTLSAAAEKAKLLATVQKVKTKECRHHKKKCKMYLVHSFADINIQI